MPEKWCSNDKQPIRITNACYKRVTRVEMPTVAAAPTYKHLLSVRHHIKLFTGIYRV